MPAAIPSPLEAPPPVIAGRYRVLEFLGGGGFGAVYKALDTRIEKTVAVKLLSATRANPEAAIKRFRAEALAASRISHPSIVGVTDFDVLPDGRPFLVMEYVAGETLEQRLARSPALPVAQAALIAQRVCQALEVAHRDQVIHRDLKPANIIVGDGESPTVKILDFGVAKLTRTPGLDGLTGAGQLLGTPAYMAPEQIREKAGPLDGRADIYALGAVLYEMLTGSVPFAGRGVADVLLAHLDEAPEPPSRRRPDVPLSLEAIVLKAMEKAPDSRYPSAAEMATALSQFLATRSATGLVRPLPRPAAATAPPAPGSATVTAQPAPKPAYDLRIAVLGILAVVVLAAALVLYQRTRPGPNGVEAPRPVAGQGVTRATDGAPPATASQPVAGAAASAPAPTASAGADGQGPASQVNLPAASQAASSPAKTPAKAPAPRRLTRPRGELPDSPATRFRIPK